jgi:hypothetical protein
MKHTKIFEQFINGANFHVVLWHKGLKSWEDEEGHLTIEVKTLQKAKKIAKENYNNDKEFNWGVFDVKKDKIIFQTKN